MGVGREKTNFYAKGIFVLRARMWYLRWSECYKETIGFLLMDINVDLTYRDFIQVIFNGILANIALLFGLYICGIEHIIDNDVFKLLVDNQFIGTIVLLPVFFVEGHTVIALDKIIFSLILCKKIRLSLFFSDCKFKRRLFDMLYGCRIYGQKCYLFEKYLRSRQGDVFRNDIQQIIEEKKRTKTPEYIKRFNTFADFFKGFCLIVFTLLIITLIQSEWVWFSVFFFIWLCSLRRQWFYSNLYVTKNYTTN